MRVIAKRTLRQFWESAPQYADAKGPLDAWYAEARKVHWRTPQDIKAQFRHASILKNHRVVFNIGGNKYRLVVWINYPYRVIYVRFIGTHAQYDRIDAQTV
jgi:mRNA interferase HigB